MGEPRGCPRQPGHCITGATSNKNEFTLHENRTKGPVLRPDGAFILLRVIAAVFDRGRREAWLFTALAVLLVLVRSAVFIFQGYVDFDSDQAIVGLMAKHLSEFRTFPLFFYGQNYMLGVQAWIIAPFFWVARPSIAVMKTPLVLLNILAALLLMRGISRQLGLRPAIGFVAALPFIMPTPVVAGNFLQTLGTSGVEPLLYILVLWMLRGRPFAFGALLAFGFLHREFTMYALPALALVELAHRSSWTATALKRVALGAGGFALVWLILDDAKMHLTGNSLLLQAQQLGKFTCFGGLTLFDRVAYVFTNIWPVLTGGTVMPLDHYAMRSSADVGSAIIGWTTGGVMLLMLSRLAWLWGRGRRESSIAFAVYLALVGCCALAAYSMTCSYAYPVVRYFSLALLLPIGCFAAFVAREPSAQLRRAVMIFFVLWGTANLVDSVRVIREAYVNPHANPHAELTEFLLSHQIRYARADYWDAYVVDFLSRERIIVSSYGVTRIPEYQQRVDEHSDTAVHIERMPCEGQMHVAVWCIQLPANRPGEGAR